MHDLMGFGGTIGIWRDPILWLALGASSVAATMASLAYLLARRTADRTEAIMRVFGNLARAVLALDEIDRNGWTEDLLRDIAGSIPRRPRDRRPSP